MSDHHAECAPRTPILIHRIGSSTLNVQFLNLMSIMVAKAGAVHVRVGGNSQEEAFLVDHIDDGHIIEKDNDNTRGRVCARLPRPACSSAMLTVPPRPKRPI